MSKKTKIIIGVASFTTILLIVVIGLIVGYSIQRNTLNLIYTKDINIELDNQAHTVSTYDFIGNENKDKLNARFDNESTSTEIMADSVCTADKTITVKYKNGALCKTQKNVKINIIDTTPPEFTEKVDSITVNKGEEIDIASKFKATDLSGEVEIKAENTVDVNTVGEQVINVSATDKNGNVNKAEVKITVIEKKEEQTESTSQKSSSKKATSSTIKNNNISNNNASSNSNKSNNNSSASKPNNNSGSATTTSGCANGNHSMPTGNIGKWFNSRNEVKNYVETVMDSWETKYATGQITWKEKCANCPQGWECWSCSRCGKWTGNFKY
ncbi:hypothetical protein [Eubacterium sp.]|uniref:hypothetical protein n=1 Tax=Eubacterium sp. TaxID=142586 RepID=UPI0039921419